MKRNVLIFLILVAANCNSKKNEGYVKRTAIVMGTVVNIEVPKSQVAAADSALQAFSLVDSLMSPVKESSDLAMINSHSGEWVKVSDLTVRCIKKALEIAELTDGAFDPTAGVLVHLWHFDVESGWQVPESSKVESLLNFVDYKSIKVDGDSVKLANGQRIDLGGIAKGFAIDLAVDRLRRAGVRSAIVDAGGDLFLVGENMSGRAWRVGIRDPIDKKRVLMVIKVKDRSVCTSGNYERFIEIGGVKYSHIFDPRTGWPVRGVLSTTVVGKDAATTDALATAIFVLGPQKGIRLIESLKDFECMIVTQDSIYMTQGFRELVEE
ncbi:MAG: FAD:protein FMN transferase [Candidatus Hydrothermota bacterium]|nr:MAG: FAD:protein FMN transferase [Candidatus Hydrothermae bacterium]